MVELKKETLDIPFKLDHTHQNHLEGLLQQIAGPHPEFLIQVISWLEQEGEFSFLISQVPGDTLDDLGTPVWELLVSPPVFINSCYLISNNFSLRNEQSKLRLRPYYLAVISLIEDWDNTYSVKNLEKN